MTKFVIDAHAWIEYLNGTEKGKKAAEIIEDDKSQNFTSSATVAEVVGKSLKENKDFNIALDYINNFSTLVNVTGELSILAGQIHFESKKKSKDFGMLDAFVVATAKKLNAKILTGDPHFKGFKEAVMV